MFATVKLKYIGNKLLLKRCLFATETTAYHTANVQLLSFNRINGVQLLLV